MTNLIHFLPLFHVDLHFHVLAAMDLRADAASVFSGARTAWSDTLEQAYLAAPGRLSVHGAPLLVADLPALVDLLRSQRLPDLRDPAGTRLARLLAEILESETGSRIEAWEADAASRNHRLAALEPWLPDLEAIFAGLWAATPSSAPRAEVHDCPSLATLEGTHGRSMLWAGRLHLALGLGGPLEQVLCQLIHEATHAVTDPPIRKAHAQVRQDTRVGSEAFALHRELERAAVAEGARLVGERAPRLLKEYESWRRRHGC